MRVVVVFLIFLIFNIAQSYTNFLHLLGWTLTGNTLKKVSAATPNDCGAECAMNKNCTGFQMLLGTGYCNLLTMLHSYKVNLAQCSYYLKQSANVTVTGRKLTSNIDIALQNAVYNSQLTCPDGWYYVLTYQLGPSKCVLSTSQTVCKQYASFFQATFSNGDCLMAGRTITYKCPDSSFTIGNYTDGLYCLKVISKWSNDTEPAGVKLYEMANQYCKDKTGGYLASIHSAAENNAINALQKKLSATSTGVMIGLVANSATITNTNEMYWLDGTGVSYTNYGANFTYDEFTYTLLKTNGQWQSLYDPDPDGSIFKYIACKQSVTATLT